MHINLDDLINIDMNRANKRLQRLFFGTVLEKYKITVTEWRALMHTYRKEPCHLRELARASKLDPTPLSRAVRSMEKQNMLASGFDPGDARRKVIFTSEKGRNLVETIWPEAVAYNKAVREHVGPEAFDALQAAAKLLQSMPPMNDKDH